MSEEIVPQQEPVAIPVEPQTQGTPVSSPAPEPTETRSYTPQEIEQLEQYAWQLHQERERLKPYQDKIRRIAEDDDYRTFVDSASQHYDRSREQSKQQQAEEVPGWFKPFAEKLEEPYRYVRSLQDQQKAQNEAQLQSWYGEQRQYATRLKAEHALTDSQISDLCVYADSIASVEKRRVGVEEAFKRATSFAPSAAVPPPVLRGDASTPGIPGRSVDKDRWKTDFHGALTEHIRNSRG